MFKVFVNKRIMKKIEGISALLLLFIAGISTETGIIPTSNDYIERCNGSTRANLFTARIENFPIYCPCMAYKKQAHCTGYLPDSKMYKVFSWTSIAKFCRNNTSEYEERSCRPTGECEIWTCECSEIKYTFQCNELTVQLTPGDL